MKSFFILLLLFTSSCSTDNNSKPTWLIGHWERINNQPNQKTYENWTKNLKGLGFTLKEFDTIFKENLEILTKNDSLYLKVSGVNELPTLFKFSHQTKFSFICENSTNKFPTKIEYLLVNDTLKAIVSNNEFSIDFKFVKK
ncbi:hypothetical protein R3X25_09945 [Lutibacter sp. TH_r2]|uniref:hypothetical protein n=1 Tax=Lutibacter sp. TH_r2 TaxID=3082083 RepID=UPI0029537484|nr:hypothetical protein [Lutibacter sp. TH_r2]MDV7187602.1 hypothetical protein [Lutibacter sp. TH_r2]